MIKSSAFDTTTTSVKAFLDSHYVYLILYLCVFIDTIAAFNGKPLAALLRGTAVTPYSAFVSLVVLIAAAILIPGFRLVRSVIRNGCERIFPTYYRFSSPEFLKRNPEILRQSVFISHLRSYAAATKHQMLWEVAKEHGQLARNREQVRDLQFCTALPLIGLSLVPWFQFSIFAEIGFPKFLVSTLGWYFLATSLSRDNAYEDITTDLGPFFAREIRKWILAQEEPPKAEDVGSKAQSSVEPQKSEFRIEVHQPPNKSVQPTPGSVTPRASSSTSK